MAKGHQVNKERRELVASFGKGLGKRSGFVCEWCGGKGDLRPWDHRPDLEPDEQTVALLCERCRDLADGRTPAVNELHSIRNALWSDVPAIAEGAAGVLARSKEAWVREAIEESLIDEDVKRRLLG